MNLFAKIYEKSRKFFNTNQEEYVKIIKSISLLADKSKIQIIQ